MEFGEFILAHDGDDLGALALARNRYGSQVQDFDLALTTLEVRRKLKAKVPQWYAVPSLQFPLRLSGEQCSSTATARYKALVACSCARHCDGTSHNEEMAKNSLCHDPRVTALRENGQKFVTPCSKVYLADLTGGLGVDSWAFAQVAEAVLYNEMRLELARAAAHNFAALGVNNVTVRCQELKPGNLASVLDGFRPQVLFLDPARRAADGRKVFKLEDCQPDVLGLLPELLAACPQVLLKISPMADISLVCKQLGCVKAVHVVASEGECKELLLLLERGFDAPYSLTVYENGHTLEIPGGGSDTQESVATLGRVRGRGPQAEGEVGGAEAKRRRFLCVTPTAGMCLYEPGKGLLKAGAFDLPCQYGLEKLGRHTHLYVGQEIPAELKPFGKCFHVLEAVPLDKRTLKDLGRRYPQAEVTARNIPLTSDQLRAKLGVRSGGSVHIFGVHVDAFSENYLLICS